MTAVHQFIPIKGLTYGKTQSTNELHISGGLRAPWAADRKWSLFPVLRDGELLQLQPLSIDHLSKMAKGIQETLFGGDEISGLGTPLITRSWTPLNDLNNNDSDSGVLWGAIANNAEIAGDVAYGVLARNIAFSIRAAGIRLRDASDGYQNQLLAALKNRTQAGKRFTNVPVADLQLAFHSVLSELASARDYLAASLGKKLGAPKKIDAMSRLAEWLRTSNTADLTDEPVVRKMLAAYDSESADPWLHHLTEYRNTFLHREPLGSTNQARWLVLLTNKLGAFDCCTIHMPLSKNDPWTPEQDALLRFIGLYACMNDLLVLAAKHAAYEATPPSFIAN